MHLVNSSFTSVTPPPRLFEIQKCPSKSAGIDEIVIDFSVHVFLVINVLLERGAWSVNTLEVFNRIPQNGQKSHRHNRRI
jgi:hypothetical protein